MVHAFKPAASPPPSGQQEKTVPQSCETLDVRPKKQASEYRENDEEDSDPCGLANFQSFTLDESLRAALSTYTM
jgi:hypothetical protein